MALLQGWSDESYRAIAPKRLVARLDGDAPPRSRSERGARRR